MHMLCMLFWLGNKLENTQQKLYIFVWERMKGQDVKGNVQPSSVLTLNLTKSVISAVRIIRQRTDNIFF